MSRAVTRNAIVIGAGRLTRPTSPARRAKNQSAACPTERPTRAALNAAENDVRSAEAALEAARNRLRILGKLSRLPLIDRSCGRGYDPPPKWRITAFVVDQPPCNIAAREGGLDGEADRATINVAAMPSSSDIFSEISPLVDGKNVPVRPTDTPPHHTPPGST